MGIKIGEAKGVSGLLTQLRFNMAYDWVSSETSFDKVYLLKRDWRSIWQYFKRKVIGQRIFHAFYNGEPVGMIIYTKEKHIACFLVLREYQKKGIGKMLVKEIVDAAGGEPIFAETGNKNAVSCYLKNGFKMHKEVKVYCLISDVRKE